MPFPPVPRQYDVIKPDDTVDSNNLEKSLNGLFIYVQRLRDTLILQDLIPATTYNAILTSITNVSSVSSVTVFQVVPIGNSITVSGSIIVTPTAAGMQTQVGISLPIPTDIQGVEQCIGLAISGDGSQIASIVGDIANDTALLQFTSIGILPVAFYFNFTYRVL